MFTIDRDKFHHAEWELIGRVISEQSKKKDSSQTKVTFTSGWFQDEEGYKRGVWKEAQRILQVGTWTEETIQSLDLTGRIIRCMDVPMDSGKKQNLLDWRETADDGGNSLKRKITADKELSDIVIYQIFCGDDERHAFHDAVNLWGARYPFISFLFFLKDIDSFAVVRPVAMKEKFEELGISSDCLKACSWENYQEFLEILKELQSMLIKDVDPAAELIDAHSFLWASWLLEKTGIDPLSCQFERIERELSRQEIFGDVRKAVIKARVNQSVFRDRLLERSMKCALCGIDHPALLTASHIYPWSESNKSEKVDADNGLLLCPDHDRLFDGGWITFSDDGRIMISKQLSANNRLFTNVREDMCIELPEGSKKYMKYHREHIFKDRTPDRSASS